MFTVSTSKHTITVTHNHPFRTQRGFLSAEALKIGDSVETGPTTTESVTGIKTSKHSQQRVINFRFDTESKDIDDHFLLSDGIATGNIFVQEALQK